MVSLTSRDIAIPGYERVIEFVEEGSGLHAIIAIHNTSLGPALGGIRLYPYQTFDAALTDVLRLSKGMTYKAAIAGTGTGGGKSVILGHPSMPNKREVLLAFAEAVNQLKGLYICAEDVGISLDDLKIIREGTQSIVGIPHPRSSGDPSRFTAHGVLEGIRALCQFTFGTNRLRGRRVAIQGLGAVGRKVAERLFWEGAHVTAADVDSKKCAEMHDLYGMEIVATDDIFQVPCDIFCPCALGAILNPQTIQVLNCTSVGGAANNQLLNESDANLLQQKGILYAPDFVINGGGLINVCMEMNPEGYNPVHALVGVNRIYQELLEIFERNAKQQKTTDAIAREIAEEKLAKRTGRRTTPPVFHH